MSHMPTGRFAHDARNASLGRGRGRIALCALATAFLAACGSDSSTTGPGGNTQKTPDGSYSISTINSAPLPVAILSDTGGYKLEVLSGTATLTTGGQYSIVTNFRYSLAGGVVNTYTDSTGGTWLLSGTTVQFTDGSDGSKDQATWSNGQLTFIEPGAGTAQITFVYKLK